MANTERLNNAHPWQSNIALQGKKPIPRKPQLIPVSVTVWWRWKSF